MSIVSTMYTGASGLQTLSSAIEVISNNIANINTIGFKGSRAEFADLISQSFSGGGGSQIGRGVSLDAVSGSFSQGSFQNTSIGTDLAISGDGFFIVSDGVADYYTRAGDFRLNENGLLVNPDGLFVQGYQYDADGNNLGSVGTINLSNISSAPKATGDGTTADSGVYIAANLDSGAEILGAFDLTNPIDTSNFSTTISVYDSLGNDHSITIYFRKSADNSWEWHAAADGGEITGGTPGVLEEGASGTITFTENGELDTEITTASDWDFAGGAAPNQSIGFDFGDSITTDSGTGLGGTTQFAGSSVVNYQTQDGYETGTLQAIQIDTEGVISGIFSNGRTRDIAQISLATFQNNNGLYRVGSNMFISTSQSGIAAISPPGTGSAGSIASSTLELSNVDLTNEFVNLITTQRGFQAASRVITTSDVLLNEVVNLGR